AVTVMAASIGWAVRDRAARQAEVAGQVRDSLNAARTLLAENKLSPAREKLTLARAQLGGDGSALADLAAEVAAGEADLARFRLFRALLGRAEETGIASLFDPPLAADGRPGRGGPPAPGKVGERRPAAAVPFLLEALQRYGVLERGDWNGSLEGGLLGSH